MSVAGLRYGADASTARGPSETRSGAPIFHGDPASYHDWEFRVSLRLELLEAQEQALRLAVQAELEDDAESGPGLATGVEDEDGKDFPQRSLLVLCQPHLGRRRRAMIQRKT